MIVVANLRYSRLSYHDHERADRTIGRLTICELLASESAG
jgi:hypothetical protein